MNKLLNEKKDELNKQLPSLNVVDITSPFESTSEDEDKSGSITSDPESISIDDDYFNIMKVQVLYFHLLREVRL